VKAVKPISLCIWLSTLLLPPAAYAPRRLLIPFGGTGSEAIGALLAGWEQVVLVEQSEEYCALAAARIAWWQRMVRETGARNVEGIFAAEDARKASHRAFEERTAGQLALWMET